MNYRLKGQDILYNDAQLGPYPEQLLKRVDKPTTEFVGTPRRKAPSEQSGTLIRKKAEAGEYSPAMNEAITSQVFGKREPLAASFTDLMRGNLMHIRDSLKPVAPEKAPIPDDPRVITRHIKSFAYFMGADAVGVCEVPEYACYLEDPKGQPFENTYKYAIVILKRKSPRTTQASTGRDRVFDACSHQAYQLLSVWTFTLTNYIRKLGYDALANNNSNYVAAMPPLIIAAGLGEGSRLGLALNPFFGANFKSAAVLTNLPLEPDKPIDFGLQKYCENCRICAEVCPAKAISFDKEKVEYNGYMTWKMDYEKHSLLAVVDPYTSSCGRCTNICPWNRPDSTPEDFKDWDGSIEALHKSVDARAKYLREHNFESETSQTDKWWFDLMLEDGRYAIPKTAEFDIPPEEESL